MCGRFCLIDPPERIAAIFEAAVDVLVGTSLDGGSWRPRYNVAPTQHAPIVRLREGERRLELARWGLVPSWAKDQAIGHRLINARSEKAASTPAFRASWKRRRCLVPASGYFEWRKGPSPRQPYLFEPADRDATPLLALAGLYERWHPTAGDSTDAPTERDDTSDATDSLQTFTILTTSPNDAAASVHDRMPVVLERDAWPAWLGEDAEANLRASGDAEPNDASEIAALARPAPDGTITVRPVSKYVNDARHEGDACIAPPDGELFSP